MEQESGGEERAVGFSCGKVAMRIVHQSGEGRRQSAGGEGGGGSRFCGLTKFTESGKSF